jgi:5'-3' exonuclease
MGVPKFFGYLLKKYKKDDFFIHRETTNSPIKHKLDGINYLMCDANGLMHPVCFKVINEHPNMTNQKDLQIIMHKAIISKIEELIEYVKPTKGVYIAIDGVAPAAKMRQQRYRRFHSVSEKNLFDKLKKKYNKPISNPWNNSVITPGTKFMSSLHEKLLIWSKQYSEKTKLEIIYSSCYTPGEGEHKLIKFMKTNNCSYVIHGLDADLIFLCLTTHKNNIYLLREANEIDSHDTNTYLKFVIMDKLRQVIPETMKTFMEFKNVDDNKLINDFIVLCYLLGNDFLPHLHAIDISNNGIEVILQIYGSNYKNYLVNDNHINEQFLLHIFEGLSKKEEHILYEKYHENTFKRRISGDLYEKEKYYIENLLFKIDDPIKIGFDNHTSWRERYYKHYWDLEKDEIELFAKKLVYHYVMGLKWVTLYYFDDCPSWDWYYPFDYPPFISDIAIYLKELNLHNIEFIKSNPVHPHIQLLTVLPPQSSFILPKHLQQLTSNKMSPLIYLYPVEIDHDYIGKHKYYQGIPKLPPMDIELVKDIYRKYSNKLSKEDISSSVKLDDFYFGLKN